MAILEVTAQTIVVQLNGYVGIKIHGDRVVRTLSEHNKQANKNRENNIVTNLEVINE